MLTDERPLVPFDEDGIREFVVSPDDAFVSWDAEGVITEWSARSESLFGWSRDEVLGRSFATTVLAPGDRIVHALRMECLLHDGERPLVGKWFELTAQRKDSREVPVEMTVWIVSNHEHHSFNAFVRDLEKRSAIEDALRDRARLQKAVDAVSHVIILTDVAGVIVYTSPSARTVLGFEADDLRGHVVDELVHVEDRALFARTLDRALRTGAQLVRAHRILTSDGRHLWMETTTAVVRDAVSGEVTGVEIVSRDITSHKLTDVARKRATGDLARMIMDLRAAVGREQEAVEELRALNRMKSDLVSNVSHELRTPLMSISSYTELLTDPSVGLLSSEQRSMLEVVERNTNRLLVTIENLLAIGGIESGALDVDPRPLDLRPLVQGAMAAMLPSARKQSIEIALDLESNPGLVLADAEQLDRVLLNLLSNAIKFTAEGGTVHVSARRLGCDVEIAVADTGIGIPLEEQERVFTPFFRSTNALERSLPGSGLGLVIVKSIIDRHGGAIELRSVPGNGTTVSFTLPAQMDEAAA